MHERQAAVVVSILIFSVIFVNESFAQTPQCNGQDATRVGTEDKDMIRGSSGDDVIVALGGNDIIFGMGGNDIICGGEGRDTIYGNSGNDILLGQQGSDTIDGGHGVDTCDTSLDDKKVQGCETQFEESHVNIDNLQEQINDLQSQINDIISGIINWADIQGIPESIADGDDDTLGELVCDVDQVPIFNGESWICGNSPQPNEDDLTRLDCNADEIAKWNGRSWECSVDVAFSASPIFFHHFRLNAGEMQWAGVTDTSSDDLDKIAIVIPTSGMLSNLYVKLGDSGDLQTPRDGEQYTITLIKNKVEDTVLTCSIAGTVNSCDSGEIKISVNAGDEILLKATSSSNAPFAIIKSSVLFEGP